MKALMVLSGGLLLAGCGDAKSGAPQAANGASEVWATAPRIESVSLSGTTAIVKGSAAPQVRVLLRGDEGEAYAVGSDDGGRFEFRLQLADDSLLLVPEIQQGQDAVRGPESLLILTEPRLAVMQVEGGPSRRLTPGPHLDAIDGDGHALVASGRAAPGQSVQLEVPGQLQMAIEAGPDGRWVVPLSGVSVQGVKLEVGGQSFTFPGAGEPLAADQVERLEAAGDGWRLTRRIGPRSVQTSWFPNP